MTVHRFFVPGDAFTGDRIMFPADVAHQIRRVLRLHSGDAVITLDGSGMEYVTRLQVGPAEISGTVEERRRNEA
jgi:16S rRNA U1498 N3-methylase RsmE